MTKTLPFSKLSSKDNDLFELVVVTARRARQINALRMAKYPLPTIGEDQEETFEETPPEIIDEPNWDEFEKPTTVAINEMLEGKISYRYAQKETNEPAEGNLEIPE